MKLTAITSAAVVAGAMWVAGGAHAATLDDVKAAGEVKCGINTGLPGFAFTDDKGNWTGFDVAYCRALSAAVFGDPDKVKYVNLTGKNRFPALASGEIDVLSRNTTWTLTRDTARCGMAGRRRRRCSRPARRRRSLPPALRRRPPQSTARRRLLGCPPRAPPPR